MKDEVEKLHKIFKEGHFTDRDTGKSVHVYLGDNNLKKILALIQKAQVEAVRAELEKLIQVGRDPGFDTPAQRLPIDNIRIYLTDRLASLTKEDGETE